jgi:hypothetical protein
MALLPFSGTVGPIFRIRDVPSRIRIRTWFHPGSRSSHFSRKRGVGRIGTGAPGAGATGIGAVPEIFFLKGAGSASFTFRTQRHGSVFGVLNAVSGRENLPDPGSGSGIRIWDKPFFRLTRLAFWTQRSARNKTQDAAW